MWEYIANNRKNKKNIRSIMRKINRLGNKAREMGFNVVIEIGIIHIDGHTFEYKNINKGWAYIKKAQPQSLDIWR